MRNRAVAIAFAVIALAITASPAAAAQLPVVYNGVLGYAHANPTASPPGANNWSCKPSAAHPVPVILVHGTFADMADSWQALSPLLYNNGYCVFALNYGSYDGSGSVGVDATGDIAASAQQLSTFVDRVLAATGAKKVDLVGHSQGGMMPRYWMRFLGGAAKVRGLVGLSPSNHGTTVGAAPFAGRNGCEACAEQVAGSAFLTRLNSGGDTLAGVNYTVVQTVHDEVVTPYTSAFLSGPGVTDVTIQDDCPLDPVEHVGIIYDAVALQWVVDALDHAGRADPGFRPVC
jgi:triacylglycerol esterase/lipase EstA (alpha/beta hydrolase family)